MAPIDFVIEMMALRAMSYFSKIEPMIANTENGVYCPATDFYIDPLRPVGRAVITHAHADHARSGCGSYLATPACAVLLKTRLGSDAKVQELPYGMPLDVNGVRLSPAFRHE